MTFLFSALTIAGGLVATSSFVVTKRPAARAHFDRIAPCEGALGVALLSAGTWWAFRSAPLLGGLFAAAPFAGFVTVGAILIDIAIGFLLSYAFLNRILLSKHTDAREKGERVRARLAMVQAPLGLIAVVLGVLVLK